MRSSATSIHHRELIHAVIVIIIGGLLNLVIGYGCSKKADPKHVGVILDASVDGLEYVVGGRRGVTVKGQFEYFEGESISFYVGGIQIGRTIPCKEVITPVDLGPGDNAFPDNPVVLNIARFLQSIDDDGVTENGIRIPKNLRTEIQALDIPGIDFEQVADTTDDDASEDPFAEDPDVLRILRKVTEVTEPWKPSTAYPEGSYVTPDANTLETAVSDTDEEIFVFQAVKPPGTNKSGQYEPFFQFTRMDEIENWIMDTYSLMALPVMETDPGYAVWTYYKNSIIIENGETYWKDGEIYWKKTTRKLVSRETALAHLQKTLAENDLSTVVFINVGDGYTAGAQCGEEIIHEYTQDGSFPALIVDQITDESGQVIWNNPLIRYDVLNQTGTTSGGYELVNDDDFPYNVATDHAKTGSLISKTDETNYSNTIYHPFQMTQPRAGSVGSISQLDAALYLADLHPDKMKIFTLWIGANDVYEHIRSGFGSALSTSALNIEALADPNEEVDGILADLDTIVMTLAAVDHSHVFIATIPDLSGCGMLIDRTDMIRMIKGIDETTDTTALTGLAQGEYIGLKPFTTYIAPYLTSSMETLSAQINQVMNEESGNYSLTSYESGILSAFIDRINTHIRSYPGMADPAGGAVLLKNVYPVDIGAFLSQSELAELYISEDETSVTITSSLGGGFYSLDGYFPSDTGYMLIADQFIEAINNAEIGVDIDTIDAAKAEAIWTADPYRDGDQDGFPSGPAPDNLIDNDLYLMKDCDDTRGDIFSSAVQGPSDCR